MRRDRLIIKQLDKQLQVWSQTKAWFQPRDGWIKVVRKALGMTTIQLAKRLGIDRSRVIRIESDETKRVLTMKTMSAVADSLDCDFVYAFVPKRSLHEMVEHQADKIAREQIKSSAHSMLLEDQGLSAEQNKEQVVELKAKLLEKSFKKLWDI